MFVTVDWWLVLVFPGFTKNVVQSRGPNATKNLFVSICQWYVPHRKHLLRRFSNPHPANYQDDELNQTYQTLLEQHQTYQKKQIQRSTTCNKIQNINVWHVSLWDSLAVRLSAGNQTWFAESHPFTLLIYPWSPSIWFGDFPFCHVWWRLRISRYDPNSFIGLAMATRWMILYTHVMPYAYNI